MSEMAPKQKKSYMAQKLALAAASVLIVTIVIISYNSCPSNSCATGAATGTYEYFFNNSQSEGGAVPGIPGTPETGSGGAGGAETPAQTSAYVNRCVDDDGNCSVSGGVVDCNGTGGYATVKSAVDAASSGETIYVCPGTYQIACSTPEGCPDITTPKTIIGPNDDVPLDCPENERVEEAILTGGLTSIKVNSDNITISGFTFNPAPARTIDHASAASARNLHITNNRFVTPSSAGSTTNGVIQLSQGDLTGLIISDNLFETPSSASPGPASVYTGQSSALMIMDDSQFDRNKFVNVYHPLMIVAYTTGAYAGSSADNVSVKRNELLNMSYRGVYTLGLSNSEVSCNKAVGMGASSEFGITIRDGNNVNVLNNNITNFTSASYGGLRLSNYATGLINSLIKCNTVSLSRRGIWLVHAGAVNNYGDRVIGNNLSDCTTGFEVQAGANASGISLNNNSIVGSTTAALNSGTGTLNAEDDWWGCAAGPGNPGCGAVSGSVDYTPWLASLSDFQSYQSAECTACQDRCAPTCTDADGDGYNASADGCGTPDCNDSDDSIYPGAEEVCNSVDDDCDNLTDEGFGNETCGVGECERTIDLCVNGTPQDCIPGDPGIETCNGLDDDCDNLTDEGFGNETCGVGECKRIVPVCYGGTPQDCIPGDPGIETCNGLDDDCDNLTDEGFGNETCGIGLCRRTVNVCERGVSQDCVSGDPIPEVCGDGIDQDCNGADLRCPTTGGGGGTTILIEAPLLAPPGDPVISTDREAVLTEPETILVFDSNGNPAKGFLVLKTPNGTTISLPIVDGKVQYSFDTTGTWSMEYTDPATSKTAINYIDALAAPMQPAQPQPQPAEVPPPPAPKPPIVQDNTLMMALLLGLLAIACIGAFLAYRKHKGKH